MTDKIIVAGDWPSPPDGELTRLQCLIRERLDNVVVIESDEAKQVRLALTKELERPEVGRHGPRLIEYFKRECLLAAVCAETVTSAGVITKEIAECAAQWVRHQLHLRIAYWPIDAGNDAERMCAAMRALLKRAHLKGVTLRQLKDESHVYRQGCGGIVMFGQAYRAMIQNQEMRKVDTNRSGRDLYGLPSEDEPLPIRL